MTKSRERFESVRKFTLTLLKLSSGFVRDIIGAAVEVLDAFYIEPRK
jgi:hypothetical protein